jgi:nucleotide-binding universal stress UspA family protein
VSTANSDGMDHGLRHGDPGDGDRSSGTSAVVVVGIDGSDTSWDAFWWACGETKRLGGRAVAVFVGPTSGVASVTASASVTGACAYGEVQQTMNDQARELCRRVRGFADEHGVEVTFVHTHGDTAKELTRIADDHHADVVVVGRSVKARHHLAGSLGRRLVGRRNAPIVVVVP